MPNRLRALREQRHLTQQALGELLDPPLPAVYIHRYESGKVKNIPIDILRQLSQALDVSTDELLGHAHGGASDSAQVGWKAQNKTGSTPPPASVDAALMAQCGKYIMSAARSKKIALYNDQWLALSVTLYNHVLAYRTKDPALVPNEALAALILERAPR